MTTFVIPIGRDRPSTLPYVLRSLEAHTPITHLITVGEHPVGVTPDEHWPSPNDQDPYLNTGGHLAKAAERLTGEWVWTADDTFLLADWTPVCHVRRYSIARHLADYPSIPTYSQGIRDSIKLMRADGYDPDTVPCGPIHRPMLVDTDRLRHTLSRLATLGVPGGVFKAFYVAGLNGVVPALDPKVNAGDLDAGDCVSVNGFGWRTRLGKDLRERFSEPSRWER